MSKQYLPRQPEKSDLYRLLVDVLRCDDCGGLYRIISIIRDEPVIVKILQHLQLPAEWPVTKPARAAPRISSTEDQWDWCVDPPAWEKPTYDHETGQLVPHKSRLRQCERPFVGIDSGIEQMLQRVGCAQIKIGEG